METVQAERLSQVVQSERPRDREEVSRVLTARTPSPDTSVAFATYEVPALPNPSGDMEDGDSPYTPLLRAVQDPFLPKPLLIAGKCLLVGISIACITIGAIYINDCPGQYLIPYYLIISGAACLLLLSLTCLPCGDGREPPSVSLATICAQSVMFLFLFAFFIAGNVWIYSLNNEPWDSPSGPKRCNRVLYLYAFWIITLCHLCAAVLGLTYLCLLLFLCILRRSMLWRSWVNSS